MASLSSPKEELTCRGGKVISDPKKISLMGTVPDGLQTSHLPLANVEDHFAIFVNLAIFSDQGYIREIVAV